MWIISGVILIVILGGYLYLSGGGTIGEYKQRQTSTKEKGVTIPKIGVVDVFTPLLETECIAIGGGLEGNKRICSLRIHEKGGRLYDKNGNPLLIAYANVYCKTGLAVSGLNATHCLKEINVEGPVILEPPPPPPPDPITDVVQMIDVIETIPVSPTPQTTTWPPGITPI